MLQLSSAFDAQDGSDSEAGVHDYDGNPNHGSKASVHSSSSSSSNDPADSSRARTPAAAVVVVEFAAAPNMTHTLDAPSATRKPRARTTTMMTMTNKRPSSMEGAGTHDDGAQGHVDVDGDGLTQARTWFGAGQATLL